LSYARKLLWRELQRLSAKRSIAARFLQSSKEPVSELSRQRVTYLDDQIASIESALREIRD
jgi:hypothetical protein